MLSLREKRKPNALHRTKERLKRERGYVDWRESEPYRNIVQTREELGTHAFMIQSDGYKPSFGYCL